MQDWFTRSFAEFSIAWLLISSVIGGIIGASVSFLFETWLPQRLKDRREILQVKRKYATPILLAADTLRKRCENIINMIELIEREGWFSQSNADKYYYLTSLHAVAQFMGWRQVLRHTVVYLDFTTFEETKRYENFLTAIQRAFTMPDLLTDEVASAPENSSDKWIYTGWLQAIGDSMIIREEDVYRIKDLASFSSSLTKWEGKTFKVWVDLLGTIFIDLKKDDPRFKRIIATHCLLNAFVDYVDPQHLRTDELAYHWDLLSPEEGTRVKNVIAKIAPKHKAVYERSGRFTSIRDAVSGLFSGRK